MPKPTARENGMEVFDLVPDTVELPAEGEVDVASLEDLRSHMSTIIANQESMRVTLNRLVSSFDARGDRIQTLSDRILVLEQTQKQDARDFEALQRRLNELSKRVDTKQTREFADEDDEDVGVRALVKTQAPIAGTVTVVMGVLYGIYEFVRWVGTQGG